MSFFRPDPKVYSSKKPKKVLQRSSIKQKKREPTGELELFKRIYEERNGMCAFTKVWVPFHVESFMHVLGKGAYPSFRLEPLNILLVVREIHRLHDNEGTTALVKKYPQCSILDELKIMLKARYQWYSENKKFNKQPENE